MYKKTYHLTLLYAALLSVCISFASVESYAQSVDVEDLVNIKKKKPFKLNGNISAGSTWFTSNQSQGRQAFTYQLVGSVNVSLYELVNIPLTFNFNNYGAGFSYPSLPNRLSLHPSYKWMRAHIGDVSMSFSPYTLSGHQFTGAGVELTPGKWQIAAMGGRLLKKVEYNPELPYLMPTYNRYGYAVKSRYNGEKFYAGGTVFTAKDKVKEASFVADSLGVFPKSNLAMSVEGGLSLIPNLNISVEYGVSILTRDTRSERVAAPNLIERIIGKRTSTSIYHAFKANLSYTFLKNNIGVGYERISPDYETLGAYYFNNDYENITLNYTRPFWQDKLNVAVSGGLQRDDLNGEKTEKNVRFVGSVNINFTPDERINASLSGSTFQGHRNIKSAFDYINEQTPYDNLDTLRFTQISHNIDFNLNWNTVKKEKQVHNLMFTSNYQIAADRQGRYILPGNLTRFINVGSSYGIDFIPLNLNVNAGVNVSNNYSASRNLLTLGPMLSVSQRLFKKQLVTGITISANRTEEEGRPLADVYNIRWNGNCRFLKRHSVQASVTFQKRDMKTDGGAPDMHSTTAIVGYTYSF